MSSPGMMFVDANCIVSIYTEERHSADCTNIVKCRKYELHISQVALGEAHATLWSELPDDDFKHMLKQFHSDILDQITILGHPEGRLFDKLRQELGDNGWRDHIEDADIMNIASAIERGCDLFVTQDSYIIDMADKISQVSLEEGGKRLKVRHPETIETQ